MASPIRVKRTPLAHRGPPPPVPVEPSPAPQYHPGPSSPNSATSPFSPWINIGFENSSSSAQYTSYPYFTLPHHDVSSSNTTTMFVGQDKYENYDFEALAAFEEQFPEARSSSNSFWNTASMMSMPQAVPFGYDNSASQLPDDVYSAFLDPGVGELPASSQMSYGALTNDPNLNGHLNLDINDLPVAPLSEAFLDADGQPIETVTAADWARLEAIEAEIEGWRKSSQQQSTDGVNASAKPQLPPLDVNALPLESFQSSSDSEVHTPASSVDGDSPDATMEVDEHDEESESS